MKKYLFILMASFFFSSISLAGYEFSYKAELFAHYHQQNFKSKRLAQEFCSKRNSWHFDTNDWQNFCFLDKWIFTDSYGRKHDRFNATFFRSVQKFDERDLQSLLNAIADWKYYQLFTGFPLQFLEVFPAEVERL